MINKKGALYGIIFFILFPLCFQVGELITRLDLYLNEELAFSSIYLLQLAIGILAGLYIIMMMAVHKRLRIACPAGRWISLCIVIFNVVMTMLPLIWYAVEVNDIVIDINIFCYFFNSTYCMLVIIVALFVIIDIIRKRKDVTEHE